MGWAGMGWDEQKVGWIDHLARVHFGHKTLLCGDQIGVILGLLAQAYVMQHQVPRPGPVEEVTKSHRAQPVTTSSFPQHEEVRHCVTQCQSHVSLLCSESGLQNIPSSNVSISMQVR